MTRGEECAMMVHVEVEEKRKLEARGDGSKV